MNVEPVEVCVERTRGRKGVLRGRKGAWANMGVPQANAKAKGRCGNAAVALRFEESPALVARDDSTCTGFGRCSYAASGPGRRGTDIDSSMPVEA